MFFKMFPRMAYEIEGEYLNYPDIFRRVGTNDAFKKFIYLDRYHIDDGERIEEVANAIYGSPEYHWVIVITNDIVDPIHEWPLSTTDLIKYCQKKYGTNGLYTVHHYEFNDASGITVDYDATKLSAGTIKSISNFDYEVKLNEAKRSIKLLKKQYLTEFVNQFKQSVRK